MFNCLFTQKTRFEKLFLLVIYFTGVFLLGNFLNWGNYVLNFSDWGVYTLPGLSIWKHAIEAGTLPFHSPDMASLMFLGDRFLAIPYEIFSPQLLLLKFMSVSHFFVLNILFLYTAGFIGLLYLKKRLSLGVGSFLALFILFNFNGHIVSHLAIGHAWIGGYFLLPWFVYLILGLFEETREWKWLFQMSLVTLFTLLQASYHYFVYELLFMASLALVWRKQSSILAKAVIFSLFGSAIRILPFFLSLNGLNNVKDFFLGGYPGPVEILESLWRQSNAGQTAFIGNPGILGGWEITFFIGISGTFIIIFWGLYKSFFSEADKRILAVPIIVLTCLSITQIYTLVLKIAPLPIFTGERAITRFLVLPFIFLIVLASRQIQITLEKAAPWKKVTYAALILGLIFETAETFKSWSFTNTAHYFYRGTIINGSYANHSDPVYIAILITGGALTLLTFWFLYHRSHLPLRKTS